MSISVKQSTSATADATTLSSSLSNVSVENKVIALIVHRNTNDITLNDGWKLIKGFNDDILENNGTTQKLEFAEYINPINGDVNINITKPLSDLIYCILVELNGVKKVRLLDEFSNFTNCSSTLAQPKEKEQNQCILWGTHVITLPTSNGKSSQSVSPNNLIKIVGSDRERLAGWLDITSETSIHTFTTRITSNTSQCQIKGLELLENYNSYLIENEEGDVISNNNGIVENVGQYPPSTDIFKTYGMSKSEINYLFSLSKFNIAEGSKLLYLNDADRENIPKLKNTIYSKEGTFFELKDNIILDKDYQNNFKKITISASNYNKNILKFIISIDDGVTWKTYKNNQWIDILKDKDSVIKDGMDVDIVNGLSEDNLKLISNTRKIKISCFIKQEVDDAPINIKQIKIDYNVN